MLRLLYTLTITAALWLTSCGTIYYDAAPIEVSTMEIPAEGGCFRFEVVDYCQLVDQTRFQPGEWFKYYRYRVIEDDIAGEESENLHCDTFIWLEFAPNDTDHTKMYTIDVKIADDFYRYDEEHRFGEWQTVWHITQPSMVGE